MASQPRLLTFALLQSSSRFGPRLGRASVANRDGSDELDIETPGLVASTSRGVIPHLSRDHARLTVTSRWIGIPFESFLEQVPPRPMMQDGPFPLNSYLGFRRPQHVVLFTLRDPADGREMPPNGPERISTWCIRGVRKVTPTEYWNQVLVCKPDIAIALSDTPYSLPPHSQKRLTKSVERSLEWLASLLKPVEGTLLETPTARHPLNVLVPMAGMTNVQAREAFAAGLTETRFGTEAEAIAPYETLDEGVSGYTFDLVPLRAALQAEADAPTAPVAVGDIVPLMEASLERLPEDKLRVVHTTSSPHEMLDLILHVGIDLFDAYWAQRAADHGVAFDFTFPAPHLDNDTRPLSHSHSHPQVRADGKHDIGHNLYNQAYAHAFVPFSSSFCPTHPSTSSSDASDTRPVCPCIACSPTSPAVPTSHSSLDARQWDASTNPGRALAVPQPAYTRAYVHHLLHTHEMSAHALLVHHNFAVLEAFLAGVRACIASDSDTGNTQADVSGLSKSKAEGRFATEVRRFGEAYDGTMAILEEARLQWGEVELARGKGRMAREREKSKLETATLGTAVDPAA